MTVALRAPFARLVIPSLSFTEKSEKLLKRLFGEFDLGFYRNLSLDLLIR